jgi:hypothetical protein
VSPWLKLDDGFDTDRRVESVSLDAIGLFTRGASYTARYFTDGLVDERWVKTRVPRKAKRDRLVRELTDAGLWRPAEGGWLIVPVVERDTDRLVHVFSRAEVESHRKAEAAKKRRQREEKAAREAAHAAAVPAGHDRDTPGSPLVGAGEGGGGRSEGSVVALGGGDWYEQERAGGAA